MYPPDELFHEIDEDARVWYVYNDEAEKLDRDMLEEAGDSLDMLLIFVRPLSIILPYWLNSRRRRFSQRWSQHLSSSHINL
jgi:hypothetical protein